LAAEGSLAVSVPVAFATATVVTVVEVVAVVMFVATSY
jgi:hypothetical protein